jgi:hypothetical protein
MIANGTRVPNNPIATNANTAADSNGHAVSSKDAAKAK